MSEFRLQCLQDSGWLARHVLGFNWDEAADGVSKRTNEGTGGLRDYGPHAEFMAFLDDESTRLKHVEMPRSALKSTGVISFCTRHIAKNRNVRIKYGMRTDTLAAEKTGAIKRILQSNARLQEMFGPFQAQPWSDDYFSVSGRDPSITDPTVMAFGVMTGVTGGRAEIIILDDIQDEKNSDTPEQREKIKRCVRQCMPLLTAGGVLIVLGTRYDGDDVYNWIINDTDGEFATLILDCGFEPVRDEAGQWDLVGKARFDMPKLQKAPLLSKLKTMGPKEFSAAYLNRIIGSELQPFRRENFQYRKHSNALLEQLSCFILTDPASSKKKRACHSVIALVGLDAALNAYLIDLRVGHWNETEFKGAFFAMLGRWVNRVVIHHEVMEKVLFEGVYKAWFEEHARLNGLRINIVQVPRYGGDQGKRQRIDRLQQRFAGNQFFVLDTVPRRFTDSTGEHVLFEPEGYKEKDRPGALPAGELVDQFVSIGAHPRMDIADALADIDHLGQDGVRTCRYVPAESRRMALRSRKPGAVLQPAIPAQDAMARDWRDETYARNFGGS